MEKEFNLNKRILELINEYINRENKTIMDIRKDWKKHKETSGRIYSNQFFAFTELRDFWLDLKDVLKEK